jgi:hypothetical protein
MTLLCLVKGQVGPVFLLGCCSRGSRGLVGVGRDGWFEELVELAGEGAFEAAFGFSDGFAFAGSAGDVGTGGRVDPGPGQHDGVQRSVELAIAGAVEPVPVGEP